MKFRFLLNDVSISLVDHLNEVDSPTFSDSFVNLNENHFNIHIPHVADISALNGDSILIQPIGDLDKKSIELYLNGSVLAAILHQRKVLPFHGSSVIHNDKGILFCGDSGAGKSTITYHFSVESDFDFLTDDITPIQFNDGKPTIMAISERMKLWSDTLEKAGTNSSQLELVRDNIDKYFIPISGKNKLVELDTIFFIEKAEVEEIEISEITGADKVHHLINNVYRKEFLQGMNSAHLDYFKKHAIIASLVNCYSLKRPANSDVERVMDEIRNIINE